MQAEERIALPTTSAAASRRPLGAVTYLLRNAGKSLPLIAVIMLAVTLIAGIVAMIDSITYSIQTIYLYSSNFVAVSPRGDPSLTPKVRQEVLSGSPVPIERVITCRVAGTQVNSIVGKWPFFVAGMKRPDIEFWLQRLHSSGLEGRLPEKGKPELIISEPVARNLHVKLGSAILKPDSQDSYSPHPVTVVGIAHTSQWTIVADYDYIAQNHFPPIDTMLFFAYDRAHQAQLDEWAFAHFKGKRPALWAYREIDKQTHTMFKTLFAILNVVIAMLVVVITIMMGMLINIYQSQRIVEYGLLQALGYTKRQLLKRTLKESAIVVVLGWLLGVALAYAVMLLFKATLMDPNAYAIQVRDPIAFRYTLPIPIAIMAVAAFTVFWRFRRFDPVGVVERRLI